MDLSSRIFRNSFSFSRMASVIPMPSFFLALACVLFCSKTASSQKNINPTVEVDRFAMEIQAVDESTSIVSSIVSFTILQDQLSGTLSLNLPSAGEIIVNKSKVRITDSRGNVIGKGSVDKKVSESNSIHLNLKRLNLSKKGTLPYTIEWETNILLSSPIGSIAWPNLTGDYSIIKYLGLRVFADEELKKRIKTNIDQSTKLMDQSTGLSGLVWEISNFQKNKAWQNAKPIENPFVEIIF